MAQQAANRAHDALATLAASSSGLGAALTPVAAAIANTAWFS
jgi:predicted trehalose synthase